MGIIRKILFWVLSLLNGLIFKINKVDFKGIEIHGVLLLYNKGKLLIGASSRINSSKYKNIIGGDTRSSIIVKKNAELKIGESFKMSNSAIYCAENIYIGDNVMIGGSCRIWDSDFHPLSHEDRIANPNEDYNTRPITICDNVFIGGFSTILKGVTIGEKSIIGAGSVVTRDIPSGEVWAGNPAVFVKKI